jgi:glutaredoxin 3
MNQINIYTMPNCSYCIAAKSLLSKKGVTYAEHNIGGDRVAAAELAQRTGRRTVPQIFIGGAHVGGFDDLRALDFSGQLDALLGG